ncbi:hypothetical protein SDC9_115045 [bioreactor metagenome]|uniref:Uncharacterized protein n=1 Tax=bioreactor metagenome TaxID=1076179 RepID=A0A645C2B3_9ZZZZ
MNYSMNAKYKKRRTYKFIFGTLAVLSFLMLIGSIGAIEQETISYMCGIVQTSISLMFFTGCTLCVINL